MHDFETQLLIELLDDGGIRITAPARAVGLLTMERARQWVAAAARDGTPVRITGALESPLGRPTVEQLLRAGADVTLAPSTPEPWPYSWTTLQMAAMSGLNDKVGDLLARGAPANASWRRDHHPYRLAMEHGHVDVLRTLRDAGTPLPRGLRPPAELPDAVVVRDYAPNIIWWLLVAAPLALIILGVVPVGLVYDWGEARAFVAVFLFFAVYGVVILLFANLLLGLACVAVDGPHLSVRRFLRWQAPVDLRRLVAVGYTRSLTLRYPSHWQLIQRDSGSPYRTILDWDMEREAAQLMRDDPTLRAVKIYTHRGYLSPGLPRHLTRYMPLDAQLTTGARAVLSGLGLIERTSAVARPQGERRADTQR